MLAAACALALPMHALASTITDGDLESGFLCTNGPSCGVGSQTFSFGGPTAPATGSITADTIGLTLTFDFDVASSTFSAISGADNGVDEVVFTNVNYEATGAVSLSLLGGDVYTINGAGGSVTVTGTYEQFLGGASVAGPTGFTSNAKPSGQCTVTGGGSILNCDLSLGPGGPFQVGVGVAPLNRRILKEFKVISAPEPGTLALLGASLIAMAIAGRRRTAAPRR
jgi:hypothetical protein